MSEYIGSRRSIFKMTRRAEIDRFHLFSSKSNTGAVAICRRLASRRSVNFDTSNLCAVLILLTYWPRYSPELDPEEHVWTRAEPDVRSLETDDDAFADWKKCALLSERTFRLKTLLALWRRDANFF